MLCLPVLLPAFLSVLLSSFCLPVVSACLCPVLNLLWVCCSEFGSSFHPIAQGCPGFTSQRDRENLTSGRTAFKPMLRDLRLATTSQADGKKWDGEEKMRKRLWKRLSSHPVSGPPTRERKSPPCSKAKRARLELGKPSIDRTNRVATATGAPQCGK